MRSGVSRWWRKGWKIRPVQPASSRLSSAAASARWIKSTTDASSQCTDAVADGRLRQSVVPGLDPGIHGQVGRGLVGWIAGSSPAMTLESGGRVAALKNRLVARPAIGDELQHHAMTVLRRDADVAAAIAAVSDIVPVEPGRGRRQIAHRE